MTMSGHDCKASLTNEHSVTPFLPRRNKQHIGIVLGLGGLYPEPETVQAVLAPSDGEQKRILDLGRCSLYVSNAWLTYLRMRHRCLACLSLIVEYHI
jgi:hypothetical protein